MEGQFLSLSSNGPWPMGHGKLNWQQQQPELEIFCLKILNLKLSHKFCRQVVFIVTLKCLLFALRDERREGFFCQEVSF